MPENKKETPNLSEVGVEVVVCSLFECNQLNQAAQALQAALIGFMH